MSDTKQLGVRIPMDLYHELKRASERRALPMNVIVSDALKLHLARLQKQTR